MENVLLEKQGHVSIITINREKALNALSTAVLNDLEEAVNTVEADKDTYCVIITGAGNKSFVAGADIAEMKDKTVEGYFLAFDRQSARITIRPHDGGFGSDTRICFHKAKDISKFLVDILGNTYPAPFEERLAI